MRSIEGEERICRIWFVGNWLDRTRSCCVCGGRGREYSARLVEMMMMKVCLTGRGQWRRKDEELYRWRSIESRRKENMLVTGFQVVRMLKVVDGVVSKFKRGRKRGERRYAKCLQGNHPWRPIEFSPVVVCQRELKNPKAGLLLPCNYSVSIRGDGDEWMVKIDMRLAWGEREEMNQKRGEEERHKWSRV